jgi:shikimate dehydrogenase
MMAAAFGELGLDWRYLRLPIPPDLFSATVRALPGSGYAGANVTIPHKLAAAELADHRTPAVEAIGAANTLSFSDGAVESDNTDAGGLIDALGEPPAGRRALVLGAGGAARAAVWALREAGAGEVSVWNRTPERAAEVAEAFGARVVERPERTDLMVNATPVGLDPGTSEEDAVAVLSLEGVEPPAVLVDLVYREGPTPLCAWASGRGARVVGGLEVLVRQGARSLERWTGRQAPVAVMHAAAGRPS